MLAARVKRARRTWRHGALAIGEHPMPGDDRQYPERRQRPGGRDEEGGVVRGPTAEVAQRVGDGTITVDAEH